MKTRTIEEVLKRHTNTLMEITGVTGTGIGQYCENPCIKVFVDKLTKDLKKKIPETLEGYQVVVEETGIFRPSGRELG